VYPTDANGTVELRVAVLDPDLDIESASYILVNLTSSTQDGSTIPTTDSSQSALPLTTVGLVGGLLLVLAVLLVALARRKNNTTLVAFSDDEVTIEPVEQQSSGLLSRVQAKQ
jgi:hypothetical protein